MNKGGLMKLNYTAEELKQIDASLPLNLAQELISNNKDTYYYVMNYNNNVLGELEKMEKKTK